MKKDPIVEEVHRVREKILDECGGNIEKLMDKLKARERNHKPRLISRNTQKQKAFISNHITSQSA